MATWIWLVKSIYLLWNTLVMKLDTNCTIQIFWCLWFEVFGDQNNENFTINFRPAKKRALNCPGHEPALLMQWACTAWPDFANGWTAYLSRLNYVLVTVELPSLWRVNCLPYQSIKDTDGIVFLVEFYLCYCLPDARYDFLGQGLRWRSMQASNHTSKLPRMKSYTSIF
jgi:hypothetical protein